MEGEKQRMESEKTDFIDKKNQNSFGSIANPTYRRPIEGEKQRMQSEKTDFIDKKIKIPLAQ